MSPAEALAENANFLQNDGVGVQGLADRSINPTKRYVGHLWSDLMEKTYGPQTGPATGRCELPAPETYSAELRRKLFSLIAYFSDLFRARDYYARGALASGCVCGGGVHAGIRILRQSL